MTPTMESAPRFGCVVIGTGHHVPQRVLGNDEVARGSGTDEGWILSRTGIRERRVLSGGESAGTLAHEAARRALANAGLEAGELDLIIVCTITPEMAVPSAACLLQRRLGLGAKGVPAFDLVAACSGFVYGLATARAHMQLPGVRHALVVGVDALSRMTDVADRNTAAILGDGAGAVVLRRSVDPREGVLFTQLGADGGGADLIYAPGGLNRGGDPRAGPVGGEYFLRMDGPRVFKLAVTRMHRLVEESAAACRLRTDEIDLLIPHQANRRILDAVADRLHLAPDRVFANIERLGNTSAASIPMAYDEARRTGIVRPGQVVVMVAFGAGLTWGSAVLREAA